MTRISVTIDVRGERVSSIRETVLGQHYVGLRTGSAGDWSHGSPAGVTYVSRRADDAYQGEDVEHLQSERRLGYPRLRSWSVAADRPRATGARRASLSVTGRMTDAEREEYATADAHRRDMIALRALERAKAAWWQHRAGVEASRVLGRIAYFETLKARPKVNKRVRRTRGEIDSGVTLDHAKLSAQNAARMTFEERQALIQ